MFFSLGLIIMYGISLNKCTCLFEILAERGSTYWKEGVNQWVHLLFSCTDFTVVEA